MTGRKLSYFVVHIWNNWYSPDFPTSGNKIKQNMIKILDNDIICFHLFLNKK